MIMPGEQLKTIKQTWVNEMNSLATRNIPFLFILDFKIEKPVIIPLDEIKPEELLYSMPGGKSNLKYTKTTKLTPFIHNRELSYLKYKRSFDRVIREINAGNSYLLNLCFEIPVETHHTLKEIFKYSNAPYKLWYKDKFIFFSPESFVKIRGDKIYTYPMKGTIEKTGPESYDKLLKNQKEAAEHATITDLLRNDLGKVAINVRVNRYRYIDEIKAGNKTLLQVSSEIEATLFQEFLNRPGSILKEILPAGSVTGAPKKKTVEIIGEVENFERGYYTGVFGIFDGKNLDSGVMIRFIEQKHGRLFYKSGGGITFMSDPQYEYNEIKQKIYVPLY